MPIFIPADVPKKSHKIFTKNYSTITHDTDQLFLFSCDQKIEHMNANFDSNISGIHEDAQNPEHLFNIASRGHVGAMVAQLGLIARYGAQYSQIPYIVKLNGRTDLVGPQHRDPISAPLWSVYDAIRLRDESKLMICGVGMTIYLGSAYEDAMLSFAAQAISQAHQEGLVAIAWMYPRGAAVKNDADADLLAGAAGVAHALGADFVKIKPPAIKASRTSLIALQKIVAAAGNTKVICAGGEKVEPEDLYTTLKEQLTHGGIAGAAIGRNIFQHSLPEAIAIASTLSTMIYQTTKKRKI